MTVTYGRKPTGSCTLTWYMDRYRTQRQKNTTLSRRASTSMAARLNTAPMRHSSSIPVCVSTPNRGPSHSRVGEDSSCSTSGLPLYRSCQRAGSSPSLPYRPGSKTYAAAEMTSIHKVLSAPLEKCHPFKIRVMGWWLVDVQPTSGGCEGRNLRCTWMMNSSHIHIYQQDRQRSMSTSYKCL